jgi:hypothetical protein
MATACTTVPCSIADQIAAHVGALTPPDTAALIGTVQCMLAVAAAEAVAAYKLSSTEAALASESLPVKKPVRSEGARACYQGTCSYQGTW